MEGYNNNTQLNENYENINNNQQNIQEEKNVIPENDINQKIENEIKEEKSIKEVDFFLMDNSQLQKYLEAKNYSENVINQIIENNLTSKDLINIVKSEESLKNLFGENYHDINSLKSLIKNEIEKILKITILIDDNREITMTLENDPEYTLENITHNLALILDSSNKIFLTPKSVPNEILLPNIKIIPRLISFPEKYSNLKVFNIKDVKKINEEKIKEVGYSSVNNKNLDSEYVSTGITKNFENKDIYSNTNLLGGNSYTSNISNMYTSSLLNNQNNQINQGYTSSLLNNKNNQGYSSSLLNKNNQINTEYTSSLINKNNQINQGYSSLNNNINNEGYSSLLNNNNDKNKTNTEYTSSIINKQIQTTDNLDKDNLNKDNSRNMAFQKIEKKSFTSDLKSTPPNQESDTQYSSYLYSSSNNYKLPNFNVGYSSGTNYQIPTKEKGNENKTEINKNFQLPSYQMSRTNYQGYSSSLTNQGGYF